jgi:hypothetical protein
MSFSQLGIAATSEISYDARLGPAHSSRQTVRRATLRFFHRKMSRASDSAMSPNL